MKLLVNISRILVGVLFIFSGLVKANDPLGLSYKMQEFFEVWGLHGLNDYTLMLSVLMNGFEIVAGVAVLLGWRMRLFSWLLLILIIFFTFLTGYALFSGKIKTCGCFGDCLPLSPTQSFWKDIFLLVLIVIILVKHQLVKPVLPAITNNFLIFLSIAFCIVGQWYVLTYLPVVDCLPYKIGNNLQEQMKTPEGALPDSFAISFKYRKDGKDLVFDMNNFPEDFDEEKYEYVDRIQKLVRPATGQAAIADFVLRNTQGGDITDSILNQQGQYIMLFVKDAGTAGKNWIEHASVVAKAAAAKGIPMYIVTATVTQVQSQLYNVDNIHIVMGDATIIKTAARVNPTYFVMDGAFVKGKFANSNYEKVVEMLK
ncbi:BT_3928 family protein [Aridibaculum aurantiacum]|uniref:BT_3928 family protein n=1 Tax=Aridibaculum aurantiacum TaxID=2810307 RepID=UPI001A9707E4|nr:BT_3928 family protein [Aridibaculum aurantiacum]